MCEYLFLIYYKEEIEENEEQYTYIHTYIHVHGHALRARQERNRTSLNTARKIPLVLYTERGHHRMPLPMDESNLFNDVGI